MGNALSLEHQVFPGAPNPDAKRQLISNHFTVGDIFAAKCRVRWRRCQSKEWRRRRSRNDNDMDEPEMSRGRNESPLPLLHSWIGIVCVLRVWKGNVGWQFITSLFSLMN